MKIINIDDFITPDIFEKIKIHWFKYEVPWFKRTKKCKFSISKETYEFIYNLMDVYKIYPFEYNMSDLDILYISEFQNIRLKRTRYGTRYLVKMGD